MGSLDFFFLSPPLLYVFFYLYMTKNRGEGEVYDMRKKLNNSYKKKEMKEKKIEN